MATKYCKKGDHRLPVSEFNKDRSSKDGLQTWCRECWKKHNKASRKAARSAKRARKGKPTPVSVPEPERPTQPALVATGPLPVPNPAAGVLAAIELLQEQIKMAGLDVVISTNATYIPPEAFPKPAPLVHADIDAAMDLAADRKNEWVGSGPPPAPLQDHWRDEDGLDVTPEPPQPVLSEPHEPTERALDDRHGFAPKQTKYSRWVAWRPSDKVRALIDDIQGQPGYCTDRHTVLRLLVQEKHNEIFGDS